jgi:predicted DNA-binding transcriptional regulator AlpA
MTDPEDPIIWRSQLHKLLELSSDTVRRMLKDGKLPKPDVDLSQKTRGWKRSTLRAAGINF